MRRPPLVSFTLACFFTLCFMLWLTGCASDNAKPWPGFGSGYWRPIGYPNILMPADEGQAKLEFDFSQCRCGIFPKNVPTPVMSQWQPDQQRMMETSVQPQPGQTCPPIGQTAFTECMRGRGWEPTLCAGRMPTDALGFCSQ